MVLRGGALPALKRLDLDENPPSKEAREYVLDKGNERPLTKPSSCGGGPSAE